MGNQVSFRALPNGEGSSFVIPSEAVGRYIQVIATRRVEDQVTFCFCLPYREKIVEDAPLTKSM